METTTDAMPGGVATTAARRQSRLAAGVAGSQILKISREIAELVAQGRTVCNLTIGDFSSAEFRIPPVLEEGIVQALRAGATNYPPSLGVPALREAIREQYSAELGLDVPLENVLVTAGARPGIYGLFRVVVDPGDIVVFPVPTWNNTYYALLVGAQGIPVATTAETAFLPTAAMLERPLRGARLLALNSPLNPAGTCFDAEGLGAICDLVLEENARRQGTGERPLYLMYDQVYWMLTYGATRHVHPLALRPELAPFTVYIDAISKSYAATGLRVGWAVGPADLLSHMSDLLGHVGAWAAPPVQLATAALLRDPGAIAAFHEPMKLGLQARLDRLFHGLMDMKARGLPVDAFPPAGAIYLSARFALNGRVHADGRRLETNEDVREYLLHEAGFAAVPFQAFGVTEDTGWFRLSAGAVSLEEIDRALPRVEAAVRALSR